MSRQTFPRLTIASFLIGASLIALGQVVTLDMPVPTRTPHPPIDRGLAIPAERNGYALAEAAAVAAFPADDEEGVPRKLLYRAAEHAGPPEQAGPPVIDVGSSRYQEQLGALHRARRAPGFQVRAGKPNVDDTAPRYSAIAALDAVALLHFRRRMAAGDLAGGWPVLLDALWLPRRLAAARGEGLGNVLVGSWCVRRAIAAAHRAGPALFASPEPLLAGVAAELDVLAGYQVDLAAAVAADRDALIESLHRQAPGPSVLSTEGLGKRWDRASAPAIGRLLDAWSEAIRDRDLERRDGIVEACRLGDDDGLLWLSRALHPLDATALFLGQTALYTAPSESAWAAEARFQGLRTELAIARYRRRYGHLPARLADLVPLYLPAVPRDPFQPATALRWDHGKLWSVGPDGTDDGGRPMAEVFDGDRWPAGDLRLIPPTYGP